MHKPDDEDHDHHVDDVAVLARANDVVVGVSRDTSSDAALAYARELAARMSVRLHVVHCIDMKDYPIDPDSADFETSMFGVAAEIRAKAEAALSYSPVDWVYHDLHGDPVRLLAEVAERHNAMMIIVGTHDPGLPLAALQRVFTHSVSRGMLKRQNRPLLVVPPLRVREVVSR
jgi:nucleotide-binding universal stress UspA family protein